jgi:hypothetical protein
MKEPEKVCPATIEIVKKAETNDFVSICRFVLEKIEAGDKKYESFEIVTSYCDRYTECILWREEKVKNYRKKVAQKSSLRQSEKIFV